MSLLTTRIIYDSIRWIPSTVKVICPYCARVFGAMEVFCLTRWGLFPSLHLDAMPPVEEVFWLMRVRSFAVVMQGSLEQCCSAPAPNGGGLLLHESEVFCPRCARVFGAALFDTVPPAVEVFCLMRLRSFTLIIQVFGVALFNVISLAVEVFSLIKVISFLLRGWGLLPSLCKSLWSGVFNIVSLAVKVFVSLEWSLCPLV